LAAKRPRLPELAWIPPGTFLRGSPLTEPDRWANEIRHAVVLTRGFFIGRQEVTQAAYAALMTNNPSTFKGADLPVENVSWFDATEYCARLTQRERSAGRLPDGWEYRLPTEAEWEYACRAGTVTATAFGNSLGSSWANFNGKTPYNGAPVGPFLAGTTPVGSYAPNGWGLDDFHGNVWEWCADWNDAYPSGRVVDPVGPPTGLIRVMRGGGWSDLGDFCRSAFRSGRVPGAAGSFLGFRVVLAREP
ncbi:MAG: formylglycine-generating enzyme family protein, partial [Verrucomicrobiota bacterium]